jgi:hypothetical protein
MMLQRSGGACRDSGSSAASTFIKKGGGRGGLDRNLTRRLRTSRLLRKRRRRADRRRVRFLSPALLIDHRPTVVEPA